jgi:cell division septation protein DedD
MIDFEEFERRLRKPLSLNQEDYDPLAELARFGGGQAEPYIDDPYRSMFEPQGRQVAGAGPAGQEQGEAKERPKPEPFIRGDFASIEAGLLGAPEDAMSDSENIVLDHREEMDGADPSAYADAEQSDEGSASYEAIRSRRPLYVMAAMIIAGVAGIFASFAFKGAVSTQDDVATIRAIDGPVKVQPETAPGNDNPGQEATILGGLPQQPPVAAASNIDQPSDLSAQTGTAENQESSQTAVAAAGSGAAAVPVPAPPAQAQARPSTEPQSIADLIEPRKVKTVSVRPDGTVVANDAPPSIAPRAAQAPVAVHPPAAPAARAATPKTAARLATTPKPPAATAPAATARGNLQSAQTTVAPKARAPEASRTFAVQLAAPTTEQEARELQARLMQKYSAEFAGFEPSIQKAAVGGKPVYRIRVGGLPSRDQATALCQKVQSSGGNCFVAKN